MAYIIGADIGTTNVKAVAFDLHGNILCSHSEDHPMYHPKPDWSEQDPEAIVAALEICIQEVVKLARPHGEAVGVCFSAAMHSLMALGETGTPLTRCIIWADNRSAALAEELRQSPRGRRLYKSNGTPIHAMTPACKLLWLRDHEPELFDRAARFVGIKEYVLFRLTGKYLIDYSLASATGLFNIRKRAWDVYTLRYLGVDAQRLSEPVSPYHTEPLPEGNRLGLPAGTPLVIGASDGCLANLGSGAVVPGTMAVTIGTSGAVRISAAEAYTDAEMRTFCYILDEKTYIVGGATNNGAVVFQWLKDMFFADMEFDDLLAEAGKIGVGSEGLLCLPYLLGERAPLWNSAVRGGFVGMDIFHKGPHFVRAVMEGILLNMYSIGHVFMENQTIHTIYANGGFAKSELWVQMLADIFGVTVNLNDTVETGSVGAAMMGLKALGYIKDYKDTAEFTPISRIFTPRADQHEKYRQLYVHFMEWAQILTVQSRKKTTRRALFPEPPSR